MEDRLRKAQKNLSNTAAEMMSSWFGQMLEQMASDPVLAQLGSAMGSGNKQGRQTGLSPYLVLGLEKTATDEEVKKRYRGLLLKLHPDTAGMEGTGFILQMVMAAYRQIAGERGWG